MKIQKLGLEWGAAYEEAQAHRIQHGDAIITVYVDEKGRLVVETYRASWYLKSASGSDCRLVLSST